MEKRIRNFVSTSLTSSKKLVSISWDKCCCPVKEGGLRIKNLRLLNKAFLAKLVASVHSAKEGVLFFMK